MSIENISTEELQEELKKRTANNTRPLPINNPDYSELVETCELVMEDYAKQGYSKDAAHYVFEKAFDSIYGPKVWEWVNEYNEGC